MTRSDFVSAVVSQWHSMSRLGTEAFRHTLLAINSRNMDALNQIYQEAQWANINYEQTC